MSAQGEKPALDDLLQSPDWLLAGVNFDQRTLSFAKVDRDTYVHSSFLDHRIKPMPKDIFTVPAQRIFYELQFQVAQTHDNGSPAEPVPPAGLILHTAFTGSTLLASCLGASARLLVLKEPLVLSHLARRWRESIAEHDKSMVASALPLLEKRYPGQISLIKPSNYANALTPLWLKNHPNRRVLVLVGSLRRFLRSNLKKEKESRSAIPGFLAALSKDIDYWEQLGDFRPDDMSWIQQCAALWHCQIVFFNRTIEQSGEQIKTLDMEQWLNQPVRTLDLASRWFGQPIGPDECEAIITDGPFQKHSKQPEQAFNPENYREQADAVETGSGGLLDNACDWAESELMSRLPVEFPLRNNLLD